MYPSQIWRGRQWALSKTRPEHEPRFFGSLFLSFRVPYGLRNDRDWRRKPIPAFDFLKTSFFKRL